MYYLINNVVDGFHSKLGTALIVLIFGSLKHIQEETENTIVQVRDGRTRVKPFARWRKNLIYNKCNRMVFLRQSQKKKKN